MKKSVLIALLLTVGSVMSSQAVVIGWAAEGLPSGTGYARLVYVADGSTPVLTDGTWSSGVEFISEHVSGAAIDGTTLYPQESTDGTPRGAGAYFVVLFDSAYANYTVSGSSIAWNNGPSISTSDFDPITGYFTPNSFPDWAPIPEPSVATLLAIGAAVAALRRRKHV